MNTDGLLLRPSSHANFELWVDEIRLSNALTVEHNSLGMGAVGHIACARGCAPGAGGNGATGLVDTFYFYDHIGNVQGASDASGALASTTAQDAWGNVLSSLTTGAWSISSSGRHLTTKEQDFDTNMNYFWNRWYDPSLGAFISRSPFQDWIEPPYSYVENQPLSAVDPNGEMSAVVEGVVGCGVGAIVGAGTGLIDRYLRKKRPYEDKCHAIAENSCRAAMGCLAGGVTGSAGVGAGNLIREALEKALLKKLGAAAAQAAGAAAGIGFSSMCKSPCEAFADSVCSAINGYINAIEQRNRDYERARRYTQDSA